MEDSYIIANFHNLCRLCLNKSTFTASIFEAPTDDNTSSSILTKISDSIEIQMDPNDGLPGRICYKCLYKVEKCSKFRMQCFESESKLRDITRRLSEMDNSNSSEMSAATAREDGAKNNGYVVGDSVVMVVDPSLDCDSSEESDTTEQPEDGTDRNNSNEEEPAKESFFRNVAMCQYCDQAFVTPEKCAEHESTRHDPNLPYSCAECSLVFAERAPYIQHNRQVHGNDKPYQCPECDKSFNRRSDLRKHSIVHTGIRPYQCQYCFKNFSRNTNLSKHLRIHTGQKPHVCPLCPRSFVAKAELDRHVQYHTGAKPYPCTKCSVSFSRKDHLLKHEERHGIIHAYTQMEFRKYGTKISQETHDMIVNVNLFNNMPGAGHAADGGGFELPSVPDHITGTSSLMDAQPAAAPRAPHPSPPKPKVAARNRPKNIKCHQCTKRFSSLDAYKTHVSAAHIGSRVFQCKDCFKKFARKRELDRHVLTHRETFACGRCERRFDARAALTEHEREHEREHEHEPAADESVGHMPCIECGAVFERKPDLVAHIKSHFSDDFEDKAAEVKKEDCALQDAFYDLGT